MLHLFFFFNDTAPTEIYPLSLHDALPIFAANVALFGWELAAGALASRESIVERSEEHTSELQSLAYLVCRLLLEKKNKLHPSTRRRIFAGSRARLLVTRPSGTLRFQLHTS